MRKSDPCRPVGMEQFERRETWPQHPGKDPFIWLSKAARGEGAREVVQYGGALVALADTLLQFPAPT